MHFLHYIAQIHSLHKLSIAKCAPYTSIHFEPDQSLHSIFQYGQWCLDANDIYMHLSCYENNHNYKFFAISTIHGFSITYTTYNALHKSAMNVLGNCL